MYLNRRDESQYTLAAILCCMAPAAHAQTSATVALTSEYSVRGVSLSDGRPAPQVGLAWDGAEGWYAGAYAAPRLVLGERSGVTSLAAYGGYAWRVRSGLAWEAGASSTAFLNAAEYNYREVYAGVMTDHLAARVYFSPAYYGYGGRSAYAELNGFYPLRERFKLIGHAGVLRGRGSPDRYDLRLAIGADIGDINVQLAWLHRTSIGALRSPRSIALSASYSF
ncbi:TorF family putative porin [Massilia sp. R2A-15]|uniref:TorF family putative porin n=1 Tax=Massilia sp. R2A-15 TaxID=3064278 RepID=UPI002736459B|nr:TorF family putative porin [Massilia sp. R2A-15]WLI90597.1 TorF family putative porin [Massilia sp. R2A-15]